MADPKHEPVAYRWPEGEYGAWVFANRAPAWPDLPEGGEVEPLYPAFTVEVLTAQLDALKEENERLKAPSPQKDVVGADVAGWPEYPSPAMIRELLTLNTGEPRTTADVVQVYQHLRNIAATEGSADA